MHVRFGFLAVEGVPEGAAARGHHGIAPRVRRVHQQVFGGARRRVVVVRDALSAGQCAWGVRMGGGAGGGGVWDPRVCVPEMDPFRFSRW